MKAKYALIALLAITFWNCDDNTAGLGLGMFPGSDQNINGKLTTFDVTTNLFPLEKFMPKQISGMWVSLQMKYSGLIKQAF